MKGPSKILNRARRDISQNLENIDKVPENSRKSSPVNNRENSTAVTAIMNSPPQPSFQQLDSGRGKSGVGLRQQNGRTPTRNGAQQHQEIARQHEELVKYFSDSWTRVCIEVEMNRLNGTDDQAGGNQIAYYHDDRVHQDLENFVPIDLEAWRDERIYQKMTQSS